MSTVPFKKNAHLPSPESTFQSALLDTLQRNGASLKTHDDIIDIINDGLRRGTLSANHPPLKSRKSFITLIEKVFETTPMKPKHVPVTLADGTQTIVSVFDIKAMILSLLTDDTLMHPDNLAPGIDIHTGKVDESNSANKYYGEVHTGNAWEPARAHYCGDNDANMPIALIVFGDKSHTDLHGSLAATPIIFTLTCFNRPSRSRHNFWRPLAYIPNLQHGKSKSANAPSVVKAQDEHKCLAVAFQSLRDLTASRQPIRACVMGRTVSGRVWIHFFVGDVSGFNVWPSHYNSSIQLMRPYCDCHCCIYFMNRVCHRCVYITLEEMRQA